METDKTAPQNAFRYNITPGKMMYIARRQLNVSRDTLAGRMNIDSKILRKMEHDQIRVPNTLLLKIFMFGLDFWTDKMTWEIPAHNPDKLK